MDMDRLINHEVGCDGRFNGMREWDIHATNKKKMFSAQDWLFVFLWVFANLLYQRIADVDRM